jgi:glycosyltransferase involved in cell wall biosynthesis
MARVSVVVPVRNRRDLLARMLDGLESQSFGDFEVVVVDDGSTDGCEDEAVARRANGLQVRVVHSHGRGAVAARRIGVEQAKSEVLAFTDSDCVPRPAWLEAGVKALDAGADVVKGATHPARWPLEPFERSMASFDEGLYPTCNMFYRRAVYDLFDGFDGRAGEQLGFRMGGRARGLGFGEDTLLAWRARRGGAQVRYEEAAAVDHHVFPPDIADSIGRVAVVGAFPALLRLVPELEPQLLRHRWLFGPRSRMPFYATVTAVILRQRGAVLAALAWWVVVRGQELRRAPVSRWRKAALLPAEMALDAATGAALLMGSARAGKLVL